jgi:hypothetical protein
MATIVFQRMSQLVTDYVMGNSGSITPPATWYMALSTTVVGSGANMARASTFSATITGSNINEIGSTTPASYARQALARTIGGGGADWIASSFDATFATGGQSTTADQLTFGPFGAGGPSPNAANSWVITETTTINNPTPTAYPYFAADTAATRTFALGDTEKVTATLKAG